MKLIDRYLYAVTERLPEDIREDVSRELRTNIEDMLPENSTEEDVLKVIEELGNPQKFANEYNPSKRYLIGPGLYDQYISVLKLVVSIVTTVLVCISLLVWTLDPPIEGQLSDNLVRLFVDLLLTMMQGVLQAALWVTLTFAILERSGVNEGQVPFHNKKWTPEDLPTIPVDSKRKISRGETVVSIFGTVFFTSLFYFHPQLIAVYLKGTNGIINSTPLFEMERLQSYIIIIVIFGIVQLGLLIWKFIAKNWNIPLAISNASYYAALCILVIVMLRDDSLFNNEFLSDIAKHTNMDYSQITLIWHRGIWIFGIAFILISMWDVITTFLKCKNKQ